MGDAARSTLLDPAPRSIGWGGLTSGPLAFGCWRFTHDSVTAAREVVETALDCGMNLVDTADIYGFSFGASEELLGQVLRDAPALRDRMLLATKGGIRPGVPYDSSEAYLRSACEASLRRLGVDVIDLYQVHRPDLLAEPRLVAEVLYELREEGKVGQIGISNYTPVQYDALSVHLVEPIATTQPELSLLHLDPIRDGTLDLCLRDGVVPLAWSPLGGGRLVTGDGVPADLLAIVDELAEREGVDRAAIGLAFVLAHPSNPVVIVGSQSPERLRRATAALSVQLDRADWYRLLEAAEGRPLP